MDRTVDGVLGQTAEDRLQELGEFGLAHAGVGMQLLRLVFDQAKVRIHGRKLRTRFHDLSLPEHSRNRQPATNRPRNPSAALILRIGSRNPRLRFPFDESCTDAYAVFSQVYARAINLEWSAQTCTPFRSSPCYESMASLLRE